MATLIETALLIAGTDTEVGKTVVTSSLAAQWLQLHPRESLGLLKPVQSGTGDLEHYCDCFDLDQAPAEITPQHFSAPLAPPLAAEQEGRIVDLAVVWSALREQLAQRRWVLVEALGGLGSPVTHEWTVADLASAWQLPVLLVVPVKLGAIAQAVANVALARQHGLTLRGLILNCPTPEAMAQRETWAPIPMIESLTQTPVLGVMPYLSAWRDRQQLAQTSTDWLLEALWPPANASVGW